MISSTASRGASCDKRLEMKLSGDTKRKEEAFPTARQAFAHPQLVPTAHCAPPTSDNSQMAGGESETCIARPPLVGGRRLGLFIHWGLYSLEGWHEQDLWRRGWKWTRESYAHLATQICPQNFAPDEWLDVAQDAGMEYLCFTAKHVDGFCLWDTCHSDFKVTKSPFGEDVLAAVSEACARRGFPLVVYYSIADLHHPAYPHAGRRWEWATSPPGDQPSQTRYLDYVRNQITELCSNYGKLQGFWWDANPAQWHDPTFNKSIRAMQPGIQINNRGFDAGDFKTPERDWDIEEDAFFTTPTEACQSIGSQSWGYRHQEDYYTDKHLLRSIARVRARGGDYLLNTGPDANGNIAREDRRILAQIGKWDRACREAFEETLPCSHLTANEDCLLTRRGNTLYVILYREPATRSIPLKPIDLMPESAVVLNTGLPAVCQLELLPWDFSEKQPFLRIHHLPLDILNETVPVIRLIFKDDFAHRREGVFHEER